jgi:hypothetical protein
MQNRSTIKTFIITFIIVGILIVLGYFFFKNILSKDPETKGENVFQKFTSLFGTAKKDNEDAILDTNPLPDTRDNQDSDTNNFDIDPITGLPIGSSLNNGQGSINDTSTPIGPGGSSTSNPIGPGLNPFPLGTNGTGLGSTGGGGNFGGGGGTSGGGTGGGGNFGGGGSGGFTPREVVPACSDGFDNDRDGKIDQDDPGCHTDLNASNPLSYDPNLDNEDAEYTPFVWTDPGAGGGGSCATKVVFTGQDKLTLEQLLREFYRLSPNLATREDVNLENINRTRYLETIGTAKNLTNQCYAQRDQYAPSKALAGGNRYLLEVREHPLVLTPKIAPSASFLTGINGIKYETPTREPKTETRTLLFKEKDKELGIEFLMKQSDEGLLGGAITSRVMQGFKDVGIFKYYMPGETISDENYEKLLVAIRRAVNNYMNNLAPHRKAWDDKLSWIGDNWAHSEKGQPTTKLFLDSYISSGKTDELRRVDIGSTLYGLVGPNAPHDDYYEIINKNLFEEFEKMYNIW